MPKGPPDSKQLGQLAMLSQVGFEMAAPIGVGALLDYHFGWAPWASVCGAILGLVGGIGHLIAMLNQRVRENSKGPERDGQ